MCAMSVIDRFYTAFAERDAATMCACYHPEVRFSDPVFPDLKGGRAGAMWTMLCEQGKDLRVEHELLGDDGARWQAWYTFRGGNAVHNDIQARFVLQDGLIREHDDRFDLWTWSRQALGATGWLLGWTPIVRNKVQTMAGKGLDKWIEEKGLPTLGSVSG